MKTREGERADLLVAVRGGRNLPSGAVVRERNAQIPPPAPLFGVLEVEPVSHTKMAVEGAWMVVLCCTHTWMTWRERGEVQEIRSNFRLARSFLSGSRNKYGMKWSPH